jgi:predicted peptidase
VRNCRRMFAAVLLFLQVSTFESRITQPVEIEYLLHVPPAAEQPPPVILYLHGGSARGDMARLRGMGLPARVAKERDFPFLVIAPLLPAGEIWTNHRELIALLDDVLAKHRADRTRVYVTGHSMGGRGALYLAYKYPERFAAVAALSAVSPIGHWATKLKDIPLRYIHGAKDVQAPIADADELMKAIGNASYDRLADRDHFLLDYYDGDELFEWLLKHRRTR